MYSVDYIPNNSSKTLSCSDSGLCNPMTGTLHLSRLALEATDKECNQRVTPPGTVIQEPALEVLSAELSMSTRCAGVMLSVITRRRWYCC